MRTLFQRETRIKAMLGLTVFAMVFTFTAFTSEAAEGKVTATAKIRAKTDTESEVVGSVVAGKTIDILGAEKDASGTVWYKVSITNGGYGYIRSDLVETNDKIEVTSSGTSTDAGSSASAQKPADTVPTAIGETAATISQESVRIRSGASTEHDVVTSLTNGTALTLIGEATDGAGKKWYQMTAEKNGKTVQGYVREDMITIGEAAAGSEAGGGNEEGSAPAEGENAEGTEEAEGTEGESAGETEGAPESEDVEPEEPLHNDYEVVYNDETYWLYDNTNGTMMSVTNLLDVVNQVNENNTSLQSQVKNEKIIIIILAVLIVILVIVMTVLIIKLKDAYYYEDYDDEEEEEEEEPEPVIPKKKKKSVESFPEETEKAAEKPVKKKRPEAELQAAEERKPVKKTPPRKSQNFLVDDDEFEFEFLNMDDKDL